MVSEGLAPAQNQINLAYELTVEVLEMADVKVNIYTPAGKPVGYFVNPQLKALSDGDYEICGQFLDAEGQKPSKLEFNPEAMPYNAEILGGNGPGKLVKVYVQSGRQPVRMSAQIK